MVKEAGQDTQCNLEYLGIAGDNGPVICIEIGVEGADLVNGGCAWWRGGAPACKWWRPPSDRRWWRDWPALSHSLSHLGEKPVASRHPANQNVLISTSLDDLPPLVAHPAVIKDLQAAMSIRGVIHLAKIQEEAVEGALLSKGRLLNQCDL